MSKKFFFFLTINSISAAIRSGDYYMFDELEDDEIDILFEDKQDDDEFKTGHPSIGEVKLRYFFFGYVFYGFYVIF